MAVKRFREELAKQKEKEQAEKKATTSDFNPTDDPQGQFQIGVPEATVAEIQISNSYIKKNGPQRKDWANLEWYLIQIMDKKSAKQIRHYTLTEEDFVKHPEFNIDLSMFKKTKWLLIQKWAKSEWRYRGNVKIRTPFLDIGKWLKFEW